MNPLVPLLADSMGEFSMSVAIGPRSIEDTVNSLNFLSNEIPSELGHTHTLS
jgi:hypothetical protein